jgi:peptide deformylase
MILPLTYYDNPILRKKGLKITVFDHKIREFADNLLETLQSHPAIGLAAQQVGEAINICVVDTTPREKEPEFQYVLDGKTPPISLIVPMILINPILKLDKSDQSTYNEGCLSFPGIFADVKRPSELVCRYQDSEGNAHELHCNGLLARVIQHEVDHLNGILYIDRMSKSTLKKIWAELEETKAKYAKK